MPRCNRPVKRWLPQRHRASRLRVMGWSAATPVTGLTDAAGQEETIEGLVVACDGARSVMAELAGSAGAKSGSARRRS